MQYDSIARLKPDDVALGVRDGNAKDEGAGSPVLARSVLALLFFRVTSGAMQGT